VVDGRHRVGGMVAMDGNSRLARDGNQAAGTSKDMDMDRHKSMSKDMDMARHKGMARAGNLNN